MGGLVPILNVNRVRAGTKQDFCLPGVLGKNCVGGSQINSFGSNAGANIART